MSSSTIQTDLIMFLTDQHRQVEQLFSQLESIEGSTGDQAQQLSEQVVMSLVQHSVAEEIYLYPTARENLRDGNQIADREVREHQEVEETLQQLESLTPDDSQFWPTVRQVIGSVAGHVQEEENELFPKLRDACSEEALRDLGQKVEQAEKFAPTRPHPSSPSEGSPLAALAPGAGLVDRVRDTLSGRGS